MGASLTKETVVASFSNVDDQLDRLLNFYFGHEKPVPAAFNLPGVEPKPGWEKAAQVVLEGARAANVPMSTYVRLIWQTIQKTLMELNQCDNTVNLVYSDRFHIRKSMRRHGLGLVVAMMEQMTYAIWGNNLPDKIIQLISTQKSRNLFIFYDKEVVALLKRAYGRQRQKDKQLNQISLLLRRLADPQITGLPDKVYQSLYYSLFNATIVSNIKDFVNFLFVDISQTKINDEELAEFQTLIDQIATKEQTKNFDRFLLFVTAIMECLANVGILHRLETDQLLRQISPLTESREISSRLYYVICCTRTTYPQNVSHLVPLPLSLKAISRATITKSLHICPQKSLKTMNLPKTLVQNYVCDYGEDKTGCEIVKTE